MDINSLNHFNNAPLRWLRRGVMAAAAVIAATLLIASCGKTRHRATPAERRAADSIVKEATSEDSLRAMYRGFKIAGNKLGCIVALRELGKLQRNESRFDDALKSHSDGLKLAEEVCDTIEMVRAMNNIGTNYRRLGILDVATNYHYRAWKISEECSDTSETTVKNLSVSLNGLGNIYMTTGNYERADSVFRMALQGEKRLRSDIGQAINYANIGSVFEKRGQTDSAWVYYRQSMKFNEAAHSILGVSLCHTNFGSLYEKEGNFDRAIDEYKKAYLLMRASKDEWHALASLLALANIYSETGKEEKAIEQLDKASKIAKRIKSKEHLAEIQNMYYLIYKKRGDWKKALECHVAATEMQDSLVGVKKLNQIQNISLAVERSSQEVKIGEARRRYEAERATRNVSIAVFSFIIILLAGAVAMMLYVLRARARTHRVLKKMSGMREAFFTNITHELRTPLTVILGMSRDIAKDTQLPERTRDMGVVMERQGNSLLTLINQLLDISKVKSAVGRQDWRHGDIAAYIGFIVDAYREHAGRKGVAIEYNTTGNLEMDFVPDFAGKVINNLLSNAIKFTPEGGKIVINVSKDDGNVLISIADTGIGIKQENLAHIFEPFYQEETDCKHIGTGVGLALVKQIIDSVKGSIEVESEVGKGTAFTLRVPSKCVDGKCRELGEYEDMEVPLQEDGDEAVEDSVSPDGDRMKLRCREVYRQPAVGALRCAVRPRRATRTGQGARDCAGHYNNRPDDARHGRPGSMPPRARRRTDKPCADNHRDGEGDGRRPHRGAEGRRRRISLQAVQRGRAARPRGETARATADAAREILADGQRGRGAGGADDRRRQAFPRKDGGCRLPAHGQAQDRCMLACRKTVHEPKATAAQDDCTDGGDTRVIYHDDKDEESQDAARHQAGDDTRGNCRPLRLRPLLRVLPRFQEIQRRFTDTVQARC